MQQKLIHMNESSKPPGKQMKDYSSYAFGERNRPRKTKNVWMMRGTPHDAASLHSKHTQECLKGRAHGIQRHVHMPITADYKIMLMLFVVNSNKLHLTALKSDVKILTQSNLSDKIHLFNSCHVAY